LRYVAASREHRKARVGDAVAISYQARLADGTSVAQVDESKPIELRIGERKLFPLVEDALIGLRPGEKIALKVPASDAYGTYQIERVGTLRRSEIAQDIRLRPGAKLRLENVDGVKFDAVVTAENSREITVDANHPLAGNDLAVEVRLLKFI
jgi:peptidylprolyl isomerase